MEKTILMKIFGDSISEFDKKDLVAEMLSSPEDVKSVLTKAYRNNGLSENYAEKIKEMLLMHDVIPLYPGVISMVAQEELRAAFNEGDIGEQGMKAVDSVVSEFKDILNSPEMEKFKSTSEGVLKEALTGVSKQLGNASGYLEKLAEKFEEKSKD